MSNSIAPGSSADVNVRVTALTTNPNVPAQYKTIILKKNLVNGVNTLTREMMSATNTKYVVKYDYVLGDDIIIPENCVLEFDGGSIRSGNGANMDTITGNNTACNKYNFEDIILTGSIYFIEPLVVPLDDPKGFIHNVLKLKPYYSDYSTVFVFSSGHIYDWSGEMVIDKKYVSLVGGGIIKGTIHIGLSLEQYRTLGMNTNWVTTQTNIIVNGLIFAKVPTSTDRNEVSQYLNDADISDRTNVSILLRNVSNVKISNCTFNNVPFPIVSIPNNEWENQCVRRLYIQCCDFDMCNTAYTAVSSGLTGSYPNDYGDTSFLNNNIQAQIYGVNVERTDGFVCNNNTFYPCLSCIKTDTCANIIISSNELFFYTNEHCVEAKSCYNDITINANICAGRGIQPLNKTAEESAYIYVSPSISGIDNVNIINNSYDDMYRLPIFIDNYESPSSGMTYIKSINIEGNSVSNIDSFVNSFTPVYHIEPSVPSVKVQYLLKSTSNPGIYDDLTFLKKHRAKIVTDYLNNKDVEKFGVYDKMRVHSIDRTKTICVIAGGTPSESGEFRFLFDGTLFSINMVSGESTILEKIKTAIDLKKSSRFTTIIVGNTLYIQSIAVITAISGFSPATANDYIKSGYTGQIYYNYGYRIVMRGIDGKKNITSRYQLAALTYEDTGLLLSEPGNSKLLMAGLSKISDTSKQTITFSTPQSSGRVSTYINSDVFISFEYKVGETNIPSILNQIMSLYDDVFTHENDAMNIQYVDANKAEIVDEYGLTFVISQSVICNGGWMAIPASFE